jgi:hypothetical protein
MLGFSSSIWTFINGYHPGTWLTVSVTLRECMILLGTSPNHQNIILQIPSAAVGVMLADRSGRRPLLLVRIAKNQLLVLVVVHQ